MSSKDDERAERAAEIAAVTSRLAEAVRLPISMSSTRPRERQAFITGEIASVKRDLTSKLKECLDGQVPFHQDLWELGLRLLQVGAVAQSYGLALASENKRQGEFGI